jgi:SAM-dependent methyltransferase
MKKDNQRNKMKENWRKMANAWAKYTPPGKPSTNEISFFEQEIKKELEHNKNIKALVLGSTPEFRDLLAKYCVDTTVADINPDSIKAMTSLMNLKNPNETVIISDWLTMPLENNTFDFVLSDSAQDNIKFEEFEAFFEKIAQVLKPEGRWFFGAVNLRRNNQISFDDYINLYKNNPAYFNDFRNFLLRIFQLAYNPEFYNEKNRTFDLYKVELKIRELVNNGSLPKKATDKLTIGTDYQMPVLSEEEFKEMLSKNFIVISQFRDKSHPAMKIKWTAILKKVRI